MLSNANISFYKYLKTVKCDKMKTTFIIIWIVHNFTLVKKSLHNRHKSIIWPHHTNPVGFALASGSLAGKIKDRDAGQQVSVGLAPPHLAELCQPVDELAGRRHLRSAASCKLSVQWTATNIGRRNFAVSGPDIWNSLSTDLCLSSQSTATFARHLKAHLVHSTEWHMPAARLSFF